jgi:hypothetical protein
VAYRSDAVENPWRSAANVVSDTPNRRIAGPLVFIAEILKPEKSFQSERTVHEHQEPTAAPIAPSPCEKAQTEAITNAVRASGF